MSPQQLKTVGYAMAQSGIRVPSFQNTTMPSPPSWPGSVVGIATDYGLDGPGIESRWGGEIFRTCPDRPWGPPSLLYNGYRVFPGPRRGADPF